MRRILRAKGFGYVCLTGTAFVVIAACGVTHPKYIDYDDEEDVGGTETPECIEAQTAFDDQLQAAVASNCAISGCHLTQPIKGKALVPGDSKVNRTQLKEYAAGSADTLYNQISSQTHTGRGAASSTPKENIEAWLAKEAACL